MACIHHTGYSISFISLGESLPEPSDLSCLDWRPTRLVLSIHPGGFACFTVILHLPVFIPHFVTGRKRLTVSCSHVSYAWSPLSRPSVTRAPKVAYEVETAGGLLRARPGNGLHYLYPPSIGQNSSYKTSTYGVLGYSLPCVRKSGTWNVQHYVCQIYPTYHQGISFFFQCVY